MLNIEGLKEWAKDSLPQGSTLRKLLLMENDRLDNEEFLAKCSTWLKLASLEEK